MNVINFDEFKKKAKSCEEDDVNIYIEEKDEFFDNMCEEDIPTIRDMRLMVDKKKDKMYYFYGEDVRMQFDKMVFPWYVDELGVWIIEGQKEMIKCVGKEILDRFLSEHFKERYFLINGIYVFGKRMDCEECVEKIKTSALIL